MQKIKTMNRLFVLTLIVASTIFSSCNKTKSWTIESPKGNILVTINDVSGDLYYTVDYKTEVKKQKALESSKLGIEREDADFSNLTFVSIAENKEIAEEYQLLSGKKLNISTVYNETILCFKNEKNNLLEIIFRVYNDGVAFTYNMPEESEKFYRITKEETTFNLGEGFAWMHAYDTVYQWAPGYETYYENKIAIGSNAPEGKNGWAFPMLFETNGLWLLISESGFDGNYGASHIEQNCEKGVYKICSAEEDEAQGFYQNTSYNTLPWQLAWRFIVIGESLSVITESDMVTHLAEPNKLDDLSWIKPGRASWSWCMSPDSPQDYELLLPFIDLAAVMGWEYSLIDANWNIMKNGDIEKLVNYANQKNVGLILWYNSGGKHNIVPEEPRDLMDTREARRAEFKRIHEMGIKGIKVDFFQSDKQNIIQQYIGILEDAAEFEIVVNFHGCTLPKGWRRTYPNLLSMEAIKGGECYIFANDFPEKAPKHLSTIPFLINVVGPCDYTPGGFSDNQKPHLTSFGFELALPVIIESGITHYTEIPEGLKQLPDYAVSFLKELPTVWNETKYLAGYPGEDAVIARRNAEKWYIGGINAEAKIKTLSIDLSALNANGKTIQIITDGQNNKELNLASTVIKNNSIQIDCLPLGGFVGIVQ